MNSAANPYLLAFDVGGTNIKWQALSLDGAPLSEIKETGSRSDQAADTIISTFRSAILDSQIEGMVPAALCFGFPGPFDYKNGISLITGLAKYEALYGLNFAALLRTRLSSDPVSGNGNWQKVPFFFENDATCFALGEYGYLSTLSGHLGTHRRIACLTIGTGLGSGFIADGHPVRGKWGIPESGMIYDQLYKNRMLDDLFSRRGLLALAEEQGLSPDEAPDVRDIAQLAQLGDKRALQVFSIFGQNFGLALNPYINSFQPDIVVLGGKIAQALPLFLPGIQSTAPLWANAIEVSDRGSASAIRGAASLFQRTHRRV